MHEYGISKNIIETLKNLKKEKSFGTIVEVKIVAGKLLQIVPDSLQFYLDIIKQDTEFSDTKFYFRENKLKIKCNDCGKSSEVEEMEFKCPVCESENIEIVDGKEFFIESVKVEDFNGG